ncbi:hypothetical protein GCM10009585_18430 [Brevibacterium paucivorans]
MLAVPDTWGQGTWDLEAPGRDMALALADLDRLVLGQRDRGLLDPVMVQVQVTDPDLDTGNRATEYRSRYTWTGRTHFQFAPSVSSSAFA